MSKGILSLGCKLSGGVTWFHIARNARASTQIVLGALILAWSSSAIAQSYPNRPIKMIVPHSVGGGPHNLGLVVGRQASKILGQPIVVEARSSGGGITGTKDVIGAKPDGYTLLFADSSAYAITPHLYPDTKFEPLKGIRAVAPAATVPLVLVVNPSLQVSTLKEFIALAKTKPGILYGTSGNGTPHHLAMELLRTLAGIDLKLVPYRGSAQESLALVAGEVSVGFLGLQSARPIADAGKVRILAVSTSYRPPEVPDIPTVAEAGVPGFEIATTVGLFVPTGTPPDIVARLHAAFAAAVRTDSVRKYLHTLGFGLAPEMSPDRYMAFAEKEDVKYGDLVRMTKAYLNVN
jgi:tripartite-type tricarboxylate transporter receptor subunit TctC